MNITEVRVSKMEDQGALKAFASIVLNDVFVVHGLRVIEGKNGLFVRMPNRKNKSDKYVDIAHPIKQEFRQEIQDKVLAEYNK